MNDSACASAVPAGILGTTVVVMILLHVGGYEASLQIDGGVNDGVMDGVIEENVGKHPVSDIANGIDDDKAAIDDPRKSTTIYLHNPHSVIFPTIVNSNLVHVMQPAMMSTTGKTAAMWANMSVSNVECRNPYLSIAARWVPTGLAMRVEEVHRVSVLLASWSPS